MGNPAARPVGDAGRCRVGRRQPRVAGLVAAVVAALGGIWITVHELRRRERRVTRKEIRDLTREVEALHALYHEQRHFIYKLVGLMIEAGLDPPQPPAPSFDPDEYS